MENKKEGEGLNWDVPEALAGANWDAHMPLTEESAETIRKLRESDEFWKENKRIMRDNRFAHMLVGMAMVIIGLIGVGVIIGLVRGLLWLIQL